jgi:T4 RnlA family RNA ligase
MFIPTYQDCVSICKNNDSFFELSVKYKKYDIKIFNYNNTIPDDFHKPFLNSNTINAYELRGICFVFDNGKLVNRYLSMNKFFNLNETSGWMYDDIKDKVIKKISVKEDGSLIRFIRVGDEAIAKTQNSINNLQTKLSNELYNTNIELKNVVDRSLDNNECLLFELVSPYNQIILNYEKTNLILLSVRDELTGKYLPVDKYDKISTKKYFRNNNNLDNLINFCKGNKNIEGFVIELEDGKMVKLKTLYYLNLHHLVGAGQFLRVNKIIEAIINNKLDDILPFLNDKNELKNRISDIQSKIKKFKTTIKNDIIEKLKQYNNNDKEFYLKYKNYTYINILMASKKKFKRNGNTISILELEQIINTFILKMSKKQNLAVDFINSI